MKTKSPKRPKPIPFRAVTKIAMVAGGEKKHPKVIHAGKVKTWVGIGWVAESDATPGDYLKFPEVK